MSKYEKFAINLSIFTAIIGLALSLHMKQGHWFGRSGAMITVIAIIFTSIELRNRVYKVISFSEKQLQIQRSEVIKQFTNAGLSGAEVEAKFQKIEEEIRKNISTEVDKVRRRLLRVEVILLVVGTLIWGFGDLPLDALWNQKT
jgi:hypothetical protein